MNRNLLIILVLIAIVYFICSQGGYKPEKNNRTVLTIFQADGTLVKSLDGSDSTAKSLVGNHKSKTLDYAAGAPIDLNNTGEIAVFVGGEKDDALLVSRDGKWIDIIDQTNLNDNSAKTYAAVSADLDNNGYTDLVVARSNGVKLYLNQGRGRFIIRELVQSSDQSIPVGLAITDYNMDGYLDIYVSQYTHPNLVRNGHPSEENYQAGLGSNLSDTMISDIMLEGLGAGMFEDVTHSVNLGKGGEVTTRKGNLGRRMNSHNGRNSGSKKAMFIDLNQDKLPDLVLTQDTGEIEIYQNTNGASGLDYAKGPSFKKVRVPSEARLLRVPSGLGYWSNISPIYENDGTVHLELSNHNLQRGGGNGNSLKTDRIILKNNGNMKFEPLFEKTLEEEDLRSAWDILMETMGLGSVKNNMDNNDMNVNANWMNIAGPYRLSRKNGHHWIGVKLPDSSPFINATIYVESINSTTGQIRKQSKQNIISSGMDQSKIVHFDLGHDDKVIHLEVNTIYDSGGNRWVHPNPRLNMIATFRSMTSNPFTAN